MPKKLTHEIFIERLSQNNNNIEALGKYVNSTANMDFKCLICGNRWNANVRNIMNRYNGCPKCGIESRKKKRTMSPDDFAIKMANNRPDLEILSDYIRSSEKVKVKSRICEHTWEAKANNLLNGSGCPACYGLKKTTDDFSLALKKISPTIIIRDSYKTSKEKMSVECSECGHSWFASPNMLLKGCGCPVCRHKLGGTKIRKSHTQFVDELKAVQPDVEVLGTYSGNKKPISLFCKKCGNRWESKPNSVLSKGSGCPRCKASHGEKAISKFLDDNDITYVQQKKFKDCKHIGCLPFDFFIPDFNLCIEYDGQLHYQAVDYFGGQDTLSATRMRDQIKNDYCSRNGIDLLRIPYWDFDNIDSILSAKFKNA